MYITPVSLMRNGTEGCLWQLLPSSGDRDLEGGGGEAELAHRHLVEEANNILRREAGGLGIWGGEWSHSVAHLAHAHMHMTRYGRHQSLHMLALPKLM